MRVKITKYFAVAPPSRLYKCIWNKSHLFDEISPIIDESRYFLLLE